MKTKAVEIAPQPTTTSMDLWNALIKAPANAESIDACCAYWDAVYKENAPTHLPDWMKVLACNFTRKGNEISVSKRKLYLTLNEALELFSIFKEEMPGALEELVTPSINPIP